VISVETYAKGAGFLWTRFWVPPTCAVGLFAVVEELRAILNGDDLSDVRSP